MMGVEATAIIQTGPAALLFAAVFLLGERLHPLRRWLDPRSVISFGGGMSAAYVFVYLMPELHAARRTFAESVSVPLRHEGMSIYFLALLGFLVFYGLDHLRAHLRRREEAGQAGLAFRLHIGGFAAYVWLMSYVLVDNLERTSAWTALYTLAIVFHCLALDRHLREEHGLAYQRIGRFVLAGMAVFGWGVGLLYSLPDYALAMLTAFISGAIIVNSALMELPTEKDGRFLWFMTGGIVYGLILVPLG